MIVAVVARTVAALLARLAPQRAYRGRRRAAATRR